MTGWIVADRRFAPGDFHTGMKPPTDADARIWIDDGDSSVTHIDVRGLQRPQPLIRILDLLRHARDGMVVIAHLDREPIALYPELAEIDWWAEPIDGGPGEVRLRLQRGDA